MGNYWASPAAAAARRARVASRPSAANACD